MLFSNELFSLRKRVRHGLLMTKNRLTVTIHSKDVTEILALYRMTEFDFPPHFLDGLMHSFPMM